MNQNVVKKLKGLKQTPPEKSLDNMKKDCPICVKWYYGKSKKRCQKHNQKS